MRSWAYNCFEILGQTSKVEITRVDLFTYSMGYFSLGYLDFLKHKCMDTYLRDTFFQKWDACFRTGIVDLLAFSMMSYLRQEYTEFDIWDTCNLEDIPMTFCLASGAISHIANGLT